MYVGRRIEDLQHTTLELISVTLLPLAKLTEKAEKIALAQEVGPLYHWKRVEVNK